MPTPAKAPIVECCPPGMICDAAVIPCDGGDGGGDGIKPTPLPPPVGGPPCGDPTPCPPCDGGGGGGVGDGNGGGGVPPTPPLCPPGYKMVPIPGGILDRFSDSDIKSIGKGELVIGLRRTGSGLSSSSTSSDGKLCCLRPAELCPPTIPPCPPQDGGQTPPPAPIKPIEGKDYICVKMECPGEDGEEPEPVEGGDECCKATADALKTLADILKEMKDKTEKSLCERLDELDECIDELIDKIKDKLIPPVKTCDECCKRMEIGLASETECAATFAHCTCSTCENECSLSRPELEGKCCKTCGKENCICKDGYCVPVEGEKKSTYGAWCNVKTGETYVTNSESNDTPPSADFQLVGNFDNYDAAYDAARAACKKQEQPPGQPIPPPQQPQFSATRICNIENYTNGTIFDNLLRDNPASIVSGYLVSELMHQSQTIVNAIKDVPVIGELAGVFAGSPGMKIVAATAISPIIAGLTGCGSGRISDFISTNVLLSSLSEIVGFDINGVAPQYTYAINANCRNAQLNTEQATAAYLANAISEQQLDSYYAISGLCEESTARIVQASKSKLIPQQLIMARRRKIIDSNEYNQRMRQLGFIDQRFVDINFDLSEQVPTMADIIQFMIRDVDDESVVKRFDLDHAFDDKYQKQLREWSEFQGIPEKAAQYAWRAHWSIPSPTQLFEFWRRLRHNGKFGGEAKLKEDIKEALVQQDILPFWHEHFIAVSTLPLTRTDTVRAYTIGSLDREQVVSSYIDAGYSDENAETLTKFTEKLKIEASANARPIVLWLRFSIDGQECKRLMKDRGFDDDQTTQAMKWSEVRFVSSPYSPPHLDGRLPRTELLSRLQLHGVTESGANKIADILSGRLKHHLSLTKYGNGYVSRAEAYNDLIVYGFPPTSANTLLDIEWQKFVSNRRIRCDYAVQQRYATGELTEDEAVQVMRGAGIVPERAEALIKLFDCKRRAEGKTVATNTLCGWLERGAITSNDFIQRMLRIGYKQQDAEQVMYDCLSKIGVKREQEARKQLLEEERMKAKAKREAEKRARIVERNLAAQERNNKLAKATRERRERQTLSIASKITKKCECEVYEATVYTKEQHRRIRGQYGVDIDESLQILIQAVDSWGGGELDSLLVNIDSMAESFLSAEAEAASGP